MDNGNKNQLKAQIQASVFKGSYIGGMKNIQAIKKSKLFNENLDKQQIDDKTFRIMPNFAKPSQNFTVYKQTARCCIQQEGFFSCLGQRKVYQLSLNNSKLAIQIRDKIYRFVDFNVVWASVSSKGKGFVIKFQQSPGFLYVQIASTSKEQDAQKWIKTINQIINTTDGKNRKFNYLASRSPLDFFKTQHVINSQFQKQANSCDIMLFKSQHSAATVQRIFTDSDYDHVAVILRNKKNQIFIYESTSDIGVGLTPWRQFIRYQWYNQIDKLCWRPLSIKLSQSDLNIIQKFIIKTLGKQFQINLEKLLTFKSVLQRSKEQEQAKSYFCSQLVARLYKQLGILDQSKSSTTYYPVDFSEKGFLKIIRPNVSIGNEKLLSFDKA